MSSSRRPGWGSAAPSSFVPDFQSTPVRTVLDYPDAREIPAERCVVCDDLVPEGRLPLYCDSCGAGLHPSCAALIERQDGWGNRRMLCAACVDESHSRQDPTDAA